MSTSRHFKGLTDEEVSESRRQYGNNLLTPPVRRSMWQLFVMKFRDPLIMILLVAGLASIGISCYEYWFTSDGVERGMALFFEPAGIFMAVLLATGLSFLFELKAESEFSILNKVNDNEPVQVIRNNAATSIPKSEVVKGDVMLLDTGCEVPADGTLLESVELMVDESSLTGEPMAHKSTDAALADPDATFESNSVMRSSKVMAGHGVMEVTAVGDATECGKVFTAAQIDNGVRTPLDEQLDRLGRFISIGAYTVAAFVVLARIWVYFSTTATFDWMEFVSHMLGTVMIAVALICVSVPEGLPMAVTLSLAYSMRRMLRTNNLVRKLHACETMGAATVICTDKTGTLTQNRMQVADEMVFVAPDQMVDLDIAIAANSTARLDFTDPSVPKTIGNPTEGALLISLLNRGIDYEKLRESVERLDEVPFSTERKFMATVVRCADGRRLLCVKGAPEIVMSMCTLPEGVEESAIETRLRSYQSQAMRTLAIAACELTDGERGVDNAGNVTAKSLRLLAIVGISDPVRAEVPAAVRSVRDAGIDIKIVTGDTPGTACEIGRQIGLWDDGVDGDTNITTGQAIAAMTDDELQRVAPEVKIVARARPLDKKRLVEALQREGEVVAVTGDGTNDAPALKAAQVGLSMGDGTSVAKEASDITIVDNSFASIGRAVMWGRSLYRNIQRFLLFQLTVNVVACITVLIGSMLGVQSPLTVTQMLWVNLIMDTFAAVALASLPPDAKVMNEKPRRRSAFIITGAMWRLIVGAGLIFTAMLLVLLWRLHHVDITAVSQLCGAETVAAHDLTPYELTVFFTTFVFIQFWNMFNARAFQSGRSPFHFRGCGGFVLIAVLIAVGQILIVEVGGAFFNVVSLGLCDWMLIVATTSVVMWVPVAWSFLKKIFAGNDNR